MAKKAHPTLVEMVKKLPPQGVLPAHYFVHTIHISPTHVSILAHFPDSVDEQGNWRFCQIVLSKFCITYRGTSDSQDDLFILRWRLCIALLSVAQHVMLLEHEFGLTKKSVEAHEVATRSPITAPRDTSCQRCGILSIRLSTLILKLGETRTLQMFPVPCLNHLPCYWKNTYFELPSRWIVSHASWH